VAPLGAGRVLDPKEGVAADATEDAAAGCKVLGLRNFLKWYSSQGRASLTAQCVERYYIDQAWRSAFRTLQGLD
jgi:hypothetical protein